MSAVTDLLISLFKLLTDNGVFGIPLLVWFLLPAVFVLVFKFIQGKK